MARYVIQFMDGREMPVDSRRFKGQMIEIIEPYTHERKMINANLVASIRRARGFERGLFRGLFQGPKFPEDDA